MSVPKSERRQSEVEYIVILQNLEYFFIQANQDENNRVPGLSDELVRLSMEAYNYGTLYFELCNGKILGDLPMKKKYCSKTIQTVRELAAQINILIRFRMDHSGKSVKGLLEKTKDILRVCDLLQAQLAKLKKSTNIVD